MWDVEQTRLTLDTDIHDNDFTGLWDVSPRQPIPFIIEPLSAVEWSYLLVDVKNNAVPTPQHPEDLASTPRFFGHLYYLTDATPGNEWAIQFLGSVYTGRELITIPQVALDLGIKFVIRPIALIASFDVKWLFF